MKNTGYIGLLICAVLLLSIIGCSGSGNSSRDSSNDYDHSLSSSLSDDEQERRAVEEELSHYHYDSFGHLYDDRD